MREKRTCTFCGASMMEHRHTFSKALAEGLYRLYLNQSAVNLKHLGLTRNQWDNFQKLRYWDLVSKATDAGGMRIGGTWAITQYGADFVERRELIHQVVWTYRGERVRYEGDFVSFQDSHGPYKTRPEYEAEARPHHCEPE